MSDFTTEVKTVTSSPSYKRDTSQASADVVLPSGSDPVVAAAPPLMDATALINQLTPQTAEAAAATTIPEVTKAKVKLLGKEFSSYEEAMTYAEELERAHIEEKSFNEGYLAARGKETQATAEEQHREGLKQKYKQYAEGLFQDPEGTIAKIQEEAVSVAVQEVKKQDAAERDRREKIQTAWTNFDKKNPDLSHFDLATKESFLQMHMKEVGHLPSEKGLEVLAGKIRGFMTQVREKSLPTKEFSSSPAQTLSPTNSGPTSQKTEEPKPLDFLSQLKQHSRRR